MKTALLQTGLIACSLSLFFSPTSLPGQSGLDLSDRELFPPEYFPSLADISDEELMLAGLQSLYPRKIVLDPPTLQLPDPAPPVVREIEPNGVYIRIKHLPEALPVIHANLNQPLVVLDLRFLTADLDATLALGSYLTRKSTFRLSSTGNYPAASEFLNGSTLEVEGQQIRKPGQTVFTLSNHETRGPLEALLAQLTLDGEIISVGAASPGNTATFSPFPGVENYHLISGEVRPADGGSLVESGFTPRVETVVTPAEDRLGYQRLRDGVSLNDLVQARVAKPRFDEARLLREHGTGTIPTNLDNNGDENGDVDGPQDPILRRALNIVKALEALGKIGT